MRASTFFALVIAVLLGLGAVAAARYTGFFQTKAPEPPPPRVEYPKVLIAKKNLYEGIAMTPTDVQVRELTADEYKVYREHPTNYLPPIVDAAMMRVMKRNVPAGQIILTEYLEPQGIPAGLSKQLAPGMSALHVSVSKDHASGGIIRVGDRVDVLLTTKITNNADGPQTTERTACIARDLRVILKRDMLWPVLAPVPENKPLAFTLEANPYRAALVAFASTKGQLTLVPSAFPHRATEANGAPRYSDPNSAEYKNEDVRVAKILSGDRSVGDGDLERIFGLPPLPIRESTQVEVLAGNKTKQVTQFTRVLDASELPAVNPDQPGYGYHFSAPPVAVEALPPAIAVRRPTKAKAQ